MVSVLLMLPRRGVNGVLMATFSLLMVVNTCSADKESLMAKLDEKVAISGKVEVEISYSDYNKKEGEDTEESDVTLATMELGIDVTINKYTKGHLLFLWEEDETEPVDLDEGTITFGGIKNIPFYLSLGKMYVPFGMYNSHFISDPLTLEIGETRESAVLLGYTNDYIDVSLGIFNGNVDKEDRDNKIESFVLSAITTPSLKDIEDLEVSFGVSFISNIADSNGLEEEVPDKKVESYIPGFGAFLSVNYGKFTFEVEYIGALKRFKEGELEFDNGKERKPRAWNYELAYAVNEKVKIAGKYEGSDDLWNFQPEEQYGLALSYSWLENITLSVEYLHGRYENKDKRNLITAQVAGEF